MAFETAYEVDEIVVGGVLGIKAVDGVIKFYVLTKNNATRYAITGELDFPIHEFSQEFSDEFTN